MSQDPIKRWIRPQIQAIKAYPVEDATGLVKLDAMENPFTWPEALQQQWVELLRTTHLNRYPDPEAHQVKRLIREAFDIPEGLSVLLGNGSDEIIQMLMLALGGENRVVLSLEPSFVMYRLVSVYSRMNYLGVSLKKQDFSLDEKAVLRAIEEHQPALVFLAYPNNPTANLFDSDLMMDIIDAAPGLVIVDEAYAPFTDASFMSRVSDCDNLLVMRTLSKMGLAGLRLGVLIGLPKWIEQINKTRLPYNINALTQLSTCFALEHKTLFDQQAQKICQMRDELIKELREINSINTYPSEANFVLIRTEQGRAEAVFENMKSQGILIKKLDGSHPLLQDCLRITVGSQDENQKMLRALINSL